MINARIRSFAVLCTIITAAASVTIACSSDTASGAPPTSGGPGESESDASAGPVATGDAAADAGSKSDGSALTDADTDIDVDGGLPSARSLVLWLDPLLGTVTDERGMTEWRDQSPARSPVTLYNGPRVYQSDPSAVPIVSFGHGAALSVTLASPLATRPFSTIFVARMYPSESATFFRTNEGDTSLAFTMSGTNRLWVTAPHKGNGATFSFNPSIPDPTTAMHVFTLRRKGNVYDVRVDGSGQSGTDPAGAYNLPAGIFLFAQAPSNYMQVGDVLLYDADLTDAKLQAAEGYLKAKYKI